MLPQSSELGIASIAGMVLIYEGQRHLSLVSYLEKRHGKQPAKDKVKVK
jgi:hypothetical protein